MADLSAWILSIGAFAAIVVCTAVAAKAIAGDPPRGRRRCPRCWHELGPDALRCAECGHEARGEADRISPAARPALLLGSLADAVLRQLARAGNDPWKLPPRIGFAPARLWLAEWRGRF